MLWKGGDGYDKGHKGLVEGGTGGGGTSSHFLCSPADSLKDLLTLSHSSRHVTIYLKSLDDSLVHI